MANIYDGYQINYSSQITITGSEENSNSLALQEANSLPLQLSGFVYSTTLGGTVVTNAFVAVYDTSDNLVASTFTDESGYYLFTSVTALTDYLVTASMSGFTPSELISVSLGTDPIEQVIVLQPNTNRAIYGITDDTYTVIVSASGYSADSATAVVLEETPLVDTGGLHAACRKIHK